MPKVINIKDAPSNWRHDSQYVYIGRTNPYEAGLEYRGPTCGMGLF